MRTGLSLALLAVVTVWSASCRAGEPATQAVPPPERVEWSLRNVLWQTLPDGIQAVFVGPDQRLWFQLRYTGPADLASMRQRIEREFRQKNPQIWGAWPVLFQAGGRVWFQTADREHILGYDGRDWTERSVEKPLRFTVNCPNHGRWGNYPYAAEVDGTAFFADTQGVHSFDGKAWAYQSMGMPSWPMSIRLMPASGGKGLLAVSPRASLWQWKGGEWTQVKSPAGVPENLMENAALWPGGDVCVQQSEPLKSGAVGEPTDRRLRFGLLGQSVEASLAAILPRLADKNFKVREEASAHLMMMGPGMTPPAEAAMKTVADPEVRARLGRALEALKAGPQESVVGPYRLRRPALLPVTIPGLVLMTAEAIQDGEKPLGPGVVVADDTGSVRALPGSDLAEALRTYLEGAPDVLILEPKKKVWIGGTYDGRLPHLLDLEKGTLTDAGPEFRFYWLQAVQADGRVYLGCGAPQAEGVVGVYTPGAPDDRRFLEVQTLAFNGSLREYGIVRMSPDGDVWAVRQGRQDWLWKFDGRRWQAVDPTPEVREVSWMQAGRGGRVLLRSPNPAAGNSEDFTLLVDGKVADRGTVESIIERRGREIAENFTGDPPPLYDYPGVRGDKAGNVWLLKGMTIRVWTGKEWLDGGQRLKDLGSAKGWIVYANAVGDGSKIYMSDDRFGAGNKAFLGEVKDGRLVIEAAPQSGSRDLMQRSPRDTDGGLWVPRFLYDRGSIPERIGQTALRVLPSGAVQELSNKGLAYLCDQGGNVWLGSIIGGRPEDFNLWREGKIVAAVSIPGAGAYHGTPMASDRPGSVWACTQVGLVHLVAEDPKAPASFAVKAVYHLKGADGTVSVMEYSPRGYLLLRGEAPIPNSGYRISWSAVVPLPKD
jgi:hypothetical protein